MTGTEPQGRAWSAHPALQPRGPQQNPGWVPSGGQVTQRRAAGSPSAPTAPPPDAGLLGGEGREPDPGPSRSGTGMGSGQLETLRSPGGALRRGAAAGGGSLAPHPDLQAAPREIRVTRGQKEAAASQAWAAGPAGGAGRRKTHRTGHHYGTAGPDPVQPPPPAGGVPGELPSTPQQPKVPPRGRSPSPGTARADSRQGRARLLQGPWPQRAAGGTALSPASPPGSSPGRPRPHPAHAAGLFGFLSASTSSLPFPSPSPSRQPPCLFPRHRNRHNTEPSARGGAGGRWRCPAAGLLRAGAVAASASRLRHRDRQGASEVTAGVSLVSPRAQAERQLLMGPEDMTLETQSRESTALSPTPTRAQEGRATRVGP